MSRMWHCSHLDEVEMPLGHGVLASHTAALATSFQTQFYIKPSLGHDKCKLNSPVILVQLKGRF